MVKFSNDADILKYEPILFSELHLPGQVLVAGTNGALSETTFTATDVDFTSASVTAGGVIHLQSADGLLDGSFEIVSVNSSTQLTVSVIRASSDDDVVAPPAATGISYHVSTFGPQAAEVAVQLTEYFGIKPGDSGSIYDTDDILDTNVLRRASVLAVISSVYARLASKASDENFWKKSLYYQRLFEQARGRCRISVGSDGVADIVIDGASLRLLRD